MISSALLNRVIEAYGGAAVTPRQRDGTPASFPLLVGIELDEIVFDP